MSDPRADRRAYLGRVGDRLGMPPDSKADILEELDGHVAESVAGLIDEGLTPELAEREALARLGDPGELADGIRRARQTRRRLLLATGFGVWAAVGGAFWGYLFAFAVVTVSALFSSALVAFALQQLQITHSGWDVPSSLMTIPFAAFAAVYAGRNVPPAVSRRSDRPVRAVASPIALAGGLALAVLAIFLVRVPLDPETVVVLLLLPVGFAAGAWTSRDNATAKGRIRLRGRWVVTTIVLTTAVLAFVATQTLRIDPDGPSSEPAFGFERVGPPADQVLGSAVVGVGTSWSGTFWTGEDPFEMELTVDPPAGLSGWRELRLEAWPADDVSSRVNASASAPVVVAPLRVKDGGWAGRLDLPVAKQRTWFVIFATGIAPDGRHYVLSGPDGPIPSRPWVGSVWEWFTTP
jgi:hypothetical protein